jgi:O-antigen ligase
VTPAAAPSRDMRARAALLTLTIAGYPLAACIQAWSGLKSRLVTVPFRAIVAALSVWVLVRAWRGGWSGYTGIVWLPLSVFWLLYCWRLASDGLLVPVAFVDPFSDYLLLGLGSSLLPMLACFAVLDADAVARARTWTLFMATIASIAAVVLSVRDVVNGNFESVLSGRLGLEALNPIALGHLGVTTCLLWMERMLSPVGLHVRVMGTAMVLFGLGVAVASGSRGPILALILCSAAMVIVARQRGRRIGGLALVSAAVLAGSMGARALEDRLGLGIVRRAGNLGDQSSLERLTIMRDAWNQFLTHPVLGNGIQEKVSGTYPHNLPLESFMATGVLGGAAFLLLLGAGAFAALRLMRAAGDGAWLGILFVQYLIAGMVSGAVHLGTTLFPLLGAAVALASTLPRTRAPGVAVALLHE